MRCVSLVRPHRRVRHQRTSLILIAPVAGVLVFIVLLLLALKFLSRCTIFFCRRSNEQPQPQAQPHEGGEDIDKDEPQLQEGGGDIDDEEPQSQEGGDETEDSGEQPQPQEQEAEEEDDKETARYTTRKYLMVVSILVASVTYQAGLIPPGGVWPDTDSRSIDRHAAGDPVPSCKIATTAATVYSSTATPSPS